jgi:transcriptional regulator with XRE-family HTH domain
MSFPARQKTGPDNGGDIGRGNQLPRPPKHVLFSKEETGRRVRTLRETQGMTQVELARTLGIPQSNVSEMERGVRGLTIHQVVKLAKALKVSTDAILVGNGKREQKTGASLKLVRRLQRIERLPESRQRVVLKFIDALIDQETATGGRHRERS